MAFKVAVVGLVLVVASVCAVDPYYLNYMQSLKELNTAMANVYLDSQAAYDYYTFAQTNPNLQNELNEKLCQLQSSQQSLADAYDNYQQALLQCQAFSIQNAALQSSLQQNAALQSAALQNAALQNAMLQGV